MKIVVDMNLGTEWIPHLASAGHDAVHWSTIGLGEADDDEIIIWARENDHVILTADLDFGARLVRSGASRPSVVQVRTSETVVSRVGPVILKGLREAETALADGALLTVEDHRFRLRLLTSPN